MSFRRLSLHIIGQNSVTWEAWKGNLAKEQRLLETNHDSSPGAGQPAIKQIMVWLRRKANGNQQRLPSSYFLN